MKQNKIPVPSGRPSESKSRPSVSIDERMNETPPPPDDIIEQMVRRPSQIPRKQSFASHLPRRKESESLTSRIHTPSLLKRSKVEDKVSWKDRIMGKRGSESKSKSKEPKVPPVDMLEKDRRLIPDNVPPPGAHPFGDRGPGSPPPKALGYGLPRPSLDSSRPTVGNARSGIAGASNSGTKKSSVGAPPGAPPCSGITRADASSPVEEKPRTLTVRNPSTSDVPPVQEAAQDQDNAQDKAQVKVSEKVSEKVPEKVSKLAQEQPQKQPQELPQEQPQEQSQEMAVRKLVTETAEKPAEKPEQQPEKTPNTQPEEKRDEGSEEKRSEDASSPARNKVIEKIVEKPKELEGGKKTPRGDESAVAPAAQEEPRPPSPVQEHDDPKEDEDDIEEKDPWHLEGRLSSDGSLNNKQEATPQVSPNPSSGPPESVVEIKVSRMSDSSTGSVASSLQSFLGDDVELNLGDDDSDKEDEQQIHAEDCEGGSCDCFLNRNNHTSWNWAIPPTPPIALQPAPPPRPSIVLSQPPSRNGSMEAPRPGSGVPPKVATALKANAVSMRRPSRPDNPWSWKLPAPDPSAPKINTVIVRRPSRLDHNTNSFGVWRTNGLSPTSSKTNTVILQRPAIPEGQMWEPSPSPMTTTFPRTVPLAHDSPTLNELSRPSDSPRSNEYPISDSPRSNGSQRTAGSPATLSRVSNDLQRPTASPASSEYNRSNNSPISDDYGRSNQSSRMSEFSNLHEFSRFEESPVSNQLVGSNQCDSPTLSDPPRFSASSTTGELPRPVVMSRPNHQPPKPYQPPKLNIPPPRPAPPSPLQQDVLEMMGKQMMRRPSRPEDALNSHPVHVRQDSAIDLCRLCHSGVAESWGVCQKCEEMTPAALRPFSGGMSEKKGRDSKQFRPPPIDVARSRKMSAISFTSSIGSDLTTPTTGSSIAGDLPHRLRPSLAENIIDEAALLEAVSPSISPECHGIQLDDPEPSDFEDAGNPFDISPEERDRFEEISQETMNQIGAAPGPQSRFSLPDMDDPYDDVAPDDKSHYDVTPPDEEDRYKSTPEATDSLQVPGAAESQFEISSTPGSRISTLPALPTPDVLARYRLDADRSDRGSRDKDDSKDDSDVYEDDWADYYFDAENFEAAKNRPRTKSAQTREAAQGYMARELSLDEYDGFWENPITPGGWI